MISLTFAAKSIVESGRVVIRRCQRCGHNFNAGAGPRRLRRRCDGCRDLPRVDRRRRALSDKPDRPELAPGEKRAYVRRASPGSRPAVLKSCGTCGTLFNAAAGVARLRKFCERCRTDPKKTRQESQRRHSRRNNYFLKLGRHAVVRMRKAAIAEGAIDRPPVPLASLTRRQELDRRRIYYNLGRVQAQRLDSAGESSASARVPAATVTE